HIGSNGYVTFGAADTLPAPDINRFFEFARISAVWSDLNPWRGGTLSYRQLSDRFVVTWANMPRHLRFDSNTAQIELRFDGVIVISWLEIGAPETIVGISTSAQAAGAPAGFVSADLTSIGAALDPRPPLALGQFVRAPAGGAATIGLTATDDGVPYNVLRYSVVGLPEIGSLRDISTGHVLGPHDLPYALGSVAQVAFEPPSDSWEGEASFEFTASDLWPEIGFDTRSSQIDPTPNDGESAPAVIVVRAGERRLVRSFMVDDTLDESEWTGLAPGEWEFGRPTGGSLQPNSNDPTSGFTGQNVLGYNLEGDYENSLSPRHVISPPIDCTGFTGTRLRFMRWLCVGSDDATLLSISNNGTTWTPLWSNPMTAVVIDRGWRMEEYDISAFADQQSTVYLRWSVGPTDGSGRFAGWNIDDVRILGFVSTPCPADVTGDGVVNARDLFGVLANFGLVDRPVVHDVNGDGAVDGEDLFLVLGAFNAVCE
ncbi:MAG: GC-type dockerin domain-anchored protein, partial [Phycisphaerales bacterium]